MFGWINGRDPRQYGVDFGLRARALVVELIAQKFGVSLGVTAVGELLAKLGLAPHKPLQRAYQRDPEGIERWQRETLPAIARQAKKRGGEVFFWDVSGFRAELVHGKTWGVFQLVLCGRGLQIRMSRTNPYRTVRRMPAKLMCIMLLRSRAEWAVMC